MYPQRSQRNVGHHGASPFHGAEPLESLGISVQHNFAGPTDSSDNSNKNDSSDNLLRRTIAITNIIATTNTENNHKNSKHTNNHNSNTVTIITITAGKQKKHHNAKNHKKIVITIPKTIQNHQFHPKRPSQAPHGAEANPSLTTWRPGASCRAPLGARPARRRRGPRTGSWDPRCGRNGTTHGEEPCWIGWWRQGFRCFRKAKKEGEIQAWDTWKQNA